MKTWTFVSNHGMVLSVIAKNSRITAAEIATELEITERSVRRIIDDLEAAGYISKVKEGRRNVYTVYEHSRMRRPQMRDVKIKELLTILTSQTGKKVKTKKNNKK